MRPHLQGASLRADRINSACNRRSVVGTCLPRYDLPIRIHMPPIRFYIPSRPWNFKCEKCNAKIVEGQRMRRETKSALPYVFFKVGK